MPFSNGREYHALLSNSDSEQTEDDDVEKSQSPTAPMSRLSKIATILAIACTTFNIVYLAYVPITLILRSEPELASLPRPNQFIGLERINYTKHVFPNIEMATFAGVIAQVDRSRPKYIYPVDPRRKFTFFGTVSPDDRNVLATNQISTIMQFQTRDFGMEWCRLKLVLPDSARYISDSAGNGVVERERNWMLEGDTSDLEVWELETSRWIDPRYLSYNTRPRRRRHIFSFNVRPNSTHASWEMHCPADRIVTYEIFCVSPKCRVDIWQNKLKPPIGLCLTTYLPEAKLTLPSKDFFLSKGHRYDL